MTMAVLAATVWFIPGWLRTAEPHEGILECVSNAFPEASVEFKSWDGDIYESCLEFFKGSI